jgi:hypothetical protein
MCACGEDDSVRVLLHDTLKTLSVSLLPENLVLTSRLSIRRVILSRENMHINHEFLTCSGFECLRQPKKHSVSVFVLFVLILHTELKSVDSDELDAANLSLVVTALHECFFHVINVLVVSCFRLEEFFKRESEEVVFVYLCGWIAIMHLAIIVTVRRHHHSLVKSWIYVLFKHLCKQLFQNYVMAINLYLIIILLHSDVMSNEVTRHQQNVKRVLILELIKHCAHQTRRNIASIPSIESDINSITIKMRQERIIPSTVLVIRHGVKPLFEMHIVNDSNLECARTKEEENSDEDLRFHN